MLTLNDFYWVLGEQRLGPLERYFTKALKKVGKKVSYINIYNIYPDYILKLIDYFHRFPRKLGNAAGRKFLNYIDSIIAKKYKKENWFYINIQLNFFKRNFKTFRT